VVVLAAWEGVGLEVGGALQMHCTENSKQIFPELKLRGLAHNFYIQVSERFIYSIPTIGPPTFCTYFAAHRYMNVEIGNKAPQFISRNT
jgi:hypothetical protein